MKKIASLLLSGILSLSMMTGCNSNDVDNSDSTSTEVNNQIENRKATDEFNEYNILTFGEIEVDNTPKYDGDVYTDFKCKVTNNSAKTIKTVTIDFGFYDEEGTLIEGTYPQEGSSIVEGQSFYIGSLYNTEEIQPKEIKITGYSYYIDDNYYTVDLIGKDAEVWH